MLFYTFRRAARLVYFGRAGQGKARQGKARQGRARQGRARQDRAGQTDRQAGWLSRQAGKQVGRQAGKQASRQADRQAGLVLYACTSIITCCTTRETDLTGFSNVYMHYICTLPVLGVKSTESERC